MSDFLFEIGLEEVPARMIAGAEAELLRRTLAMLGKEALLGEGFDPLTDAKSYSTPRRLAVFIRNVKPQQADITEEVTGPAAKIAYKDGLPTPAAEAFAKKNGIAVKDLRTITTPKGEYLAATSVKKGRSANEVIASELPKEIAAIYWAKSMYWRSGKPERFVRPVRWMVCLLGDDVVPVEFGGKTAGRITCGHRILFGSEPIELPNPDDYLEVLRDAFVEADVEVRRESIRKALDRTRRGIEGARWREDEPLVDKLTHLTEWPSVILGNFEKDYLALPEEVLVTVMRDHQNYFAIEDKTGKLLPHFLAVLSTELLRDGRDLVRQGNERVLRARFNDARFFWEFDQRTPLTERVKLLENVTFQKDLGSYAAKSKRVEVIAQNLATLCRTRGTQLNEPAIGEAARLAKTDLTTELVKEFTELQGVIGGLYAHKQGTSATVADAIYDQYLPASADDAIPRSAEGAVLGLADRIDTIAGMFGLGMEPTGSKDPFALRRAANAIVRILAESELPLLLSDVFSSAQVQAEVKAKLEVFFAERVDFYLREACGQAYDVVKAVMAPGYDDIRDTVARAEAVSTARGSEDFLTVSAAFKRMKNILAQADFHLDSGTATVASEGTPERNLHRKYAELVATVGELCQRHAYREALEAIATIRPEVDAFFEKVMVMDPDLDVRRQRLFLLATILKSFSSIADFSEIVIS
jgi:glycyl-tRNA synthetase beta chain